MTLEGIDQQGRITDWQRAKALGKAYAISRLVGENGAVDPDCGPNTTGAEGAGIIPGGYHFIASGTAAAHCRIFVDAMGDPTGQLVMVDVENPNYHPAPTAYDVAAWFDEYRKHQPLHPVILYTRANFWAALGNPKITDPHTVVMTSGYPGGSAYPGDNAPRWSDRFGGTAPRFWQYAGTTDLGLGAAVDLSAFKGTLAELQTLAAAGGVNPPFPIPDPVEDPMGLQFRITERVTGTVTMGAGHALIRVDTEAYVPTPTGQVREVAAKIALTATGGHGLPVGTKGYLVGNIPGALPDTSIAAFVLETDGVFTATPQPPAAPDILHDVRLTVDGVEKARVTV